MVKVNYRDMSNIPVTQARKILQSLDDDVCSGRRKRLYNLNVEEKLLRRKLKNRVAAQTARDRKKAYMDNLEDSLSRMERENKIVKKSNEELRVQMLQLKDENARLKSRLVSTATSLPDYSTSSIEDTASYIVTPCIGDHANLVRRSNSPFSSQTVAKNSKIVKAETNEEDMSNDTFKTRVKTDFITLPSEEQGKQNMSDALVVVSVGSSTKSQNASANLPLSKNDDDFKSEILNKPIPSDYQLPPEAHSNNAEETNNVSKDKINLSTKTVINKSEEFDMLQFTPKDDFNFSENPVDTIPVSDSFLELFPTLILV